MVAQKNPDDDWPSLGELFPGIDTRYYSMAALVKLALDSYKRDIYLAALNVDFNTKALPPPDKPLSVPNYSHEVPHDPRELRFLGLSEFTIQLKTRLEMPNEWITPRDDDDFILIFDHINGCLLVIDSKNAPPEDSVSTLIDTAEFANGKIVIPKNVFRHSGLENEVAMKKGQKYNVMGMGGFFIVSPVGADWKRPHLLQRDKALIPFLNAIYHNPDINRIMKILPQFAAPTQHGVDHPHLVAE